MSIGFSLTSFSRRSKAVLSMGSGGQATTYRSGQQRDHIEFSDHQDPGIPPDPCPRFPRSWLALLLDQRGLGADVDLSWRLQAWSGATIGLFAVKRGPTTDNRGAPRVCARLKQFVYADGKSPKRDSCQRWQAIFENN
jgi:hypothetical protein